jgi:hypothetical protein
MVLQGQGVLLPVYIAVLAATNAGFASSAEIDAAGFATVVAKSSEVWLVYFKGGECSSCVEFDATWTELAASLNRVSTGELTLGYKEADALAEAYGVTSDSLPSLRLFRSLTDRPIVVMEGKTLATVKSLRKAMKRNLKGLEKSSGVFVKNSGDPRDINFLVQSQLAAHHEKTLAEETRDQLIKGGVKSTRVHLLHRIHERWDTQQDGPPYHVDYWCYTPWLLRLNADKSSKSKWYVFLDPETSVNLPVLKRVLATKDYRELHFFGHQLVDKVSSVARSYDTSTPYPLKKAGFVISGGLFDALMKSIEEEELPVEQNIDALFQLTELIKRRAKVGFKNDKAFCKGGAGDGTCATYFKSKEAYRKDYGLTADEVIIGIKTTGMSSEQSRHDGDGILACFQK